MNEFKNVISEAQAENDARDRKQKQQSAEQLEILKKRSDEIRSWEKEVFYPLVNDADDALKDIKGRIQCVNTQSGLYSITLQAGGKGQAFILNVARDGTLNVVTHGGYGANELGKISNPETTKQLKELLVEAVRKAAS